MNINMRLHRFFVEEKLEGSKEVRIHSEAVLHQMRNVFRLGSGDFVVLFNGEGKDYECKIKGIYPLSRQRSDKMKASFHFAPRSSEIKLLSKNEGIFEVVEVLNAYIPEKKVELYLALIKKENFEWAIEKATEIGVSKIIPIITEYTQKRNLDIERARKIIREASEQCGRGDIPEISEPIHLSGLKLDNSFTVFDISGSDLKAQKLTAKSFKLLIGPEGGWSDEELKRFENSHTKMFSLGKTTLRAETAAVVASVFAINS